MKQTGNTGKHYDAWLWASANRPKREADSASSFGQMTRSGVQPVDPHQTKESAKDMEVNFCRLLESDPSTATTDGKRYKVVLIKEGLGNFKDGFYYTKEAIQSAAELFDGDKMFVNHPDSIEEQTRPERSVEDIGGHFENVGVEESEDGRSMLVGEVVVMDGADKDWLRALFNHDLDFKERFPGKEFIGLSINANGKAVQMPVQEFLANIKVPPSAMIKVQEAIDKGITTFRVVSEIASTVSCDLVTAAGAGGEILQLLEGEKKPMSTKTKTAKTKESEPAAGQNPAQAKPGTVPAKTEAGAGGTPPPAGGAHADADQDKELIKGMLDKYVGAGPHDDDTVGAAHEAYQAAVASGLQGEEAEKAVGYGMKMAGIMKQKQAEAEAKQAEAEEKAKEAKAKEDEAKQAEAKESAKSLADQLATLRESVSKLQGENAALNEKVKSRDLQEYLDKKLQESKLPRAATNKFREMLGDLKSENQIDSELKNFTEGYKLAGGEAQTTIFGSERQVLREAGAGKGKVSFSDCKS